MRNNSNDRTVEWNYVQKFRFLIREYELVKAKPPTPAPPIIYAITKRHGLNRLTKPMQQSRRQIFKTRAGGWATSIATT